MTDYETQIAQLEAQLARAKAEKEKQDAILAKLTPEQALAEKLHAKLCYENHTDGCGWHYEKWNDPSYAKKMWKTRAIKVLAICEELRISEDDALKIITAIKSY